MTAPFVLYRWPWRLSVSACLGYNYTRNWRESWFAWGLWRFPIVRGSSPWLLFCNSRWQCPALLDSAPLPSSYLCSCCLKCYLSPSSTAWNCPFPPNLHSEGPWKCYRRWVGRACGDRCPSTFVSNSRSTSRAPSTKTALLSASGNSPDASSTVLSSPGARRSNFQAYYSQSVFVTILYSSGTIAMLDFGLSPCASQQWADCSGWVCATPTQKARHGFWNAGVRVGTCGESQ